MSDKYKRPVVTNTCPDHQRGAVLVVGLITLLILTIIGVYASRSSTMGTMMATNAQHVAQALAAAENAVITAEKRLINEFAGAPPFDLEDDQTDGLYGLDSVVDIDQLDWNAATGIEREFDADGNLSLVFIFAVDE